MPKYFDRPSENWLRSPLNCQANLSYQVLPLDHVATGVSKPIGMVSFFYDLGIFDTWPKLKQFLERYLPASFFESPPGQLLQRRIREYLLGRRVDSVIFN